MYSNIPLKNPSPDAGEFLAIILGKKEQTRTPLVEYIIDAAVQKVIIEDLLDREWTEDREGRMDNFIQVWYRMGYDFVRFEQGLPFYENRIVTTDTAEASKGERAWVDQHTGAITNWADFETYAWPKIEDFDFGTFEYINRRLPDGMGFITCHGGGILEHTTNILSYEGLCLALFDQPDLVQAVFDRVGELLYSFYEHLLDLENVSVIFQGDDMGFRTGTLISPDDLRKYSLPWHTKYAALAHAKGRPYFLHSCGQLKDIMDDLIDDVKIDAKHSYENAITPVEEMQEIYGKRIGILGGIDVDILSASSPEEVRAETRRLIDLCGPRGRYAIGSGNSIPSYVPAENYLAMIDEAHA